MHAPADNLDGAHVEPIRRSGITTAAEPTITTSQPAAPSEPADPSAAAQPAPKSATAITAAVATAASAITATAVAASGVLSLRVCHPVLRVRLLSVWPGVAHSVVVRLERACQFDVLLHLRFHRNTKMDTHGHSVFIWC